MKWFFKWLFFCLFFVSCQHKITPEDVVKLNGYWEIEKVEVAEGEDKNYKINENFDYFEIKNNVGFRKKVKPQLDGTFIANDSYEKIKVRFEKEAVYLDYSTDFAKWSEELVKVTDEELVVRNEENKEYHYKKTGAINLTGNGETTK
ncbi:lipocalin family protein [Flavobacterium sp. UMI-01]|uniref:lipocalin family protein n=1 Tax=Flavobacterium sp. UMI-01 TaxID=1441053 RepID=UPI001C7DFC0F|nr:lipocalin family protein [Flavobacterium sp. UMI-01]GIZ09963.1 hypothetical protein FUMI01_26890 [Flavobacterium sp. UMI-01]